LRKDFSEEYGGMEEKWIKDLPEFQDCDTLYE